MMVTTPYLTQLFQTGAAVSLAALAMFFLGWGIVAWLERRHDLTLPPSLRGQSR